MRIYICAPEGSVNQEIRTALHSALTKFYGRFPASDIEFFPSPDAKTSVYIMEKAPRITDDSLIIRNITQILGDTVSIKLNYQHINPDFRPDTTPKSQHKPKDSQKLEEFDYKKLSLNYHAETPHYSFDQVILPEETRSKILEAVATIQVEPKVFDEWGLRTIIPYAASAMSFYGPPGTGKTMAAEAVANMLGKKIIRAAYADIESKYHGEGPKMVKAIFLAAEREDAVLFLDESDSLLSKRLTDVRSGSEQAIN